MSPFIKLNSERSYSLSSLVLIFFSFSAAGWLWEVFLHIFMDGAIINRGVLLGPWLPIYGTGGILILTLLKKWRCRPLRTLFLVMLLCGSLEYITGTILEILFHARWWDYNDLPFNIHGRVCLGGLLLFGFGGLIFIYIIAPKLDTLFEQISTSMKRLLCCILITFFIFDVIYSFLFPNMGFGITLQ